MNHDTNPKMIGDYKDVDDVGPFLPDGESQDNGLILKLKHFFRRGEWKEERCRCHIYCLLCKKEISNVDFLGYGFHIRHGYRHYIAEHQVVIDKDLATAAIQFFKETT